MGKKKDETFEGIEALPSGRYRARGWDRTRQARFAIKGTFASQHEAFVAKIKAERERDERYRQAGTPVPRGRSGDTLAGAFEHVVGLRDGTKWDSPATATNYRKLAAILQRAFGAARSPSSLTTDEIEVWLATCGYARSTKRTLLTVLRDVVPGQNVVPKLPRAEIDVERRRVTAVELNALLGVANPRVRLAILLAHDAGLRMNEVCGLRWYAVLRDGGRPRALAVAETSNQGGYTRNVTKGGKRRVVPVSARLASALEEAAQWPGTSESGYVLRNERRSRRDGPEVGTVAVSNNSLGDRFRHACRAAGLRQPAPRFHDLRHAFGTNLAEAAVPIETVRKLMGHASLATTEVYIATATEEAKEAAIARVEEALSER